MHIAFLFFLILSFPKALFASAINWDKMEMTGMACPGGQTQREKNVDSILVRFPQFQVRGTQRKACDLVLPIVISATEKILVEEIFFNGKQTKSGARGARIQLKMFMAKDKSFEIKEEKEWTQEGSFLLKLPPKATPCGVNDNLRWHLSIFNPDKDRILEGETLSIRLKIAPCETKAH